MLPFHNAEIHELFYDFSLDLVERAIPGCLSAAYHLQKQPQYRTSPNSAMIGQGNDPRRN